MIGWLHAVGYVSPIPYPLPAPRLGLRRMKQFLLSTLLTKSKHPSVPKGWDIGAMHYTIQGPPPGPPFFLGHDNQVQNVPERVGQRSVARCESRRQQYEKFVVSRALVRIVTPGAPTQLPCHYEAASRFPSRPRPRPRPRALQLLLLLLCPGSETGHLR